MDKHFSLSSETAWVLLDYASKSIERGFMRKQRRRWLTWLSEREIKKQILKKWRIWIIKIKIFVQIDKPLKNPYETKPGDKPYKLEIVWRNVLLFIVLHAMAVYGFMVPAKTGTYWIGEFVVCFSYFFSVNKNKFLQLLSGL